MPISKRLLELPKWCVPQIDSIMVLSHVKPMIPNKTSAIEKWYSNRIKRAFGKYLNSCIKDVTRANLVILQNE